MAKTYKVVLPGAQVFTTEKDGDNFKSKFIKYGETVSLDDDELALKLMGKGIIAEASKTEAAELEALEKAAAASTTTNKPRKTPE